MLRKILLAIALSPLAASAAPDLETRSYAAEPYSAGDNPYKVKRYAPQYFAGHSKHFEEYFAKHPEAPIWTIIPPNAMASIHVIDAPEGLIVIDTGLNTEQMLPVVDKIKELTDKPIKAVVYTHPHADHTGGIAAFITQKQADSGEVEVIGDSNFMDAYVSENSATGPLMGQRAMVMYGALLQPEDREQYSIGCCGYLTLGATSFIAPTRVIEDEETLDVAGMELTFVHSGGENAGHMVIFAPQYDTVFTGDELQGPAAPQLHSPRGTKFRDTEAWMAAIDRIRALNPAHLLPGHGKPEHGREHVASILTLYRDSMQFQHDQAIRLINQGKGPDQLANEIVIPDYLTLDPFTIQTYGTVKTIVRSYFTGYVSWFDGNPANLDPLPKAEEDGRLIEAMGGRDAVVKLAEKALKDGDIKWSLALSDRLVRVDHDDVQARQLKAAGLRHLGYASINSSNRSFYLSGADELDSILDMSMVAAAGRQMLAGPQVIAGLGTEVLLDNLRYKLLPEAVGASHTAYYFDFTDTGEVFTLTLRNGILDVVEGGQKHDVAVTLDREGFNTLFTSDAPVGLESIAKVEGKKADVKRFDEAFDYTIYPISLAVQ